MMKKLIKMGWLGAVACVAIGCSDYQSPDDEGDPARCYGHLGIEGVASAEVVTRAESGTIGLAGLGLQVPQSSALRLTLTGKNIAELESGETGPVEVSRFDYNKSWTTLADYDNENPALFPGQYTALLEYGEPEAIGPDKAYYRGEATGTVEIGQVTRCSVKVKIVNSAVRITADDKFKGYFTDAQFRLYLNGSTEPLKNDEGEAIDFTLENTEPIFMPAGTKVVVKGKANRPSQGTDKDGNPLPAVELPIEVPVRTTAASTLHTFQFTADAGGAKIEVEFKDFEVVDLDDVELNDDAKPDEPAPDDGSQDSGEQGGSQDSGTPDSGEQGGEAIQ